jgi:hypothetical protein
MAQSPFEIRLELLKMAQTMLEQEFYGKKEILMNGWHAACGSAERSNQDVPVLPELPSYPSEQDIIAKARELNEFVSGK